MKKLFSFLLVLCFSVNVMANGGPAGSTAGLERAMDNYQYALTVEWDQKDQKVYQAKTQAFFAEMAKLISEQGLSREEVLAVAQKKMSNKAQLEALKLKLSLAGSSSSANELGKILQDSVKDMYQSGASWNGEAVVPVLAGLAVAALIGYVIWFHATHKCVAYAERWECNSYSECDTYGDYCWTEESCGWNSYCTKYEKN